jgi:hypothetical protein
LKSDPDCEQQLEEWKAEVLAWEADNTAANPYDIRHTRESAHLPLLTVAANRNIHRRFTSRSPACLVNGRGGGLVSGP